MCYLLFKPLKVRISSRPSRPEGTLIFETHSCLLARAQELRAQDYGNRVNQVVKGFRPQSGFIFESIVT